VAIGIVFLLTIFVEQPSPEPKVKILIPMYEPLQVSKCKKYGKIMAEPKELIRIIQTENRPQGCW
jgi:hypothetical protein